MPYRSSAIAVPRSRSATGGGAGQPPLFQRSFSADDRETRAVLCDLVATLQKAALDPEDISNAELILAEVLNNIAEHAYAGSTGPVDLLVMLGTTGMACEVSDLGAPMPSGAAPDPDLPEIAPPDHLPEGGFGWHIIRCLTVDLTYVRNGKRNTLSMRIPWAAAG